MITLYIVNYAISYIFLIALLRLTLTLAMFTLGVGCNGALYSGWIINTQDIAPNFAGTVLGLTNCMGAIPGFVAPTIASQITHEDVKDTNKWDTVWLITIVILTLESIFYIIFADGEPQSWNHPDKDYEEKAKTKKRDWFLVSSKNESINQVFLERLIH